MMCSDVHRSSVAGDVDSVSQPNFVHFSINVCRDDVTARAVNQQGQAGTSHAGSIWRLTESQVADSQRQHYCPAARSALRRTAITTQGIVLSTHICNSQPLHVTSAPSPKTFWRRGWSRFCSAAVFRPNTL